MKRTLPTMSILLLAALYASDTPVPQIPAAGSVTHAPHPHFRWQRETDVKIDEVHRIQIARDEQFAEIVCDDRLEVVSRFVPVKPLAPGKYCWRVQRGEDQWTLATAFEVREPVHVFTIPAGSDAAAVTRTLEEAAASCPARVNFEPGEYRLGATHDKCLATIRRAHDLIINGHGATLVLGGTFLNFVDCERVTIQRFTVTADQPGHTLVRITKKGDACFTAKPEPGYDQDVLRFFRIEESGGSFLGCLDAEHHGRYIPGGGISARNAKVAVAPDEPGAFVFSPVKATTLDLMPVGALAVVTAYHWQWVQMNRCDEYTFSDVILTDLPGAFCGGSNNSAKSYLNCQVKRRSPKDYFGGHSACGSGRVGEWVEGCLFECLPDDGPAEQSFRQPIKSADGVDAILLAGSQAAHALHAGNRVTLVNPKTRRGTSVDVLAATPVGNTVRVQINRPLVELAAEIGADWSRMFLYCDSPSNEDFVYRRNRHIGGRGHGVKFNGTRAWIADNHFENINGNAVLAGYVSEVSGHGARDVVISGNTIVRCGWTPIEACSTSGLGGNIIIRENRIVEARNAAVRIGGCSEVVVSGNDFTSSTVPTRGVWIATEKSKGVRYSGNHFQPVVPEIQQAALGR